MADECIEPLPDGFRGDPAGQCPVPSLTLFPQSLSCAGCKGTNIERERSAKGSHGAEIRRVWSAHNDNLYST